MQVAGKSYIARQGNCLIRCGSIRVFGMSSNPRRSLGIRVETETIYWAVVEGTANDPVVIGEGKIPAPASADDAGRLVAHRRAVLDVIAQHDPAVVFVRSAETMFGNRGEGPRKRLRLEGVIMEAAASKSKPVRSGPLATIGKGLGIDAATAKTTRDCALGLGTLDWAQREVEAREAIMAAAATLN